ncbi:MAG: 1-acyl-sn-glycerol-3-phosphate acyltransferase, partial [Acidobacteria bacterium]
AGAAGDDPVGTANDPRRDLDEAERLLRRAPFVRDLVLLPRGEGRPWAVVWPDEAALRKGGHGDVSQQLRFSLETSSVRLPVGLRPAGITVARGRAPRSRAGEVDRAALARLLGPVPPGVWPARPPEPRHPLPAEWARALAEALPGGAPEGGLWRETSLELDLGLDSLDRVTLALAAAEAAGRPAPPDEAIERVTTLGELVDLAGGPPREPVRPRPELVFAGEPASGFWLRPARGTWPAVALCRTAGGALLARLLGGVRAEGTGAVDWDERPLILAANHQSHLDAALLARACPARVHRHLMFLGYTGYFSAGFGRLVGRLFRICPVSGGPRLLSGLRTAAAALRAGRVVGIFPEGERTWDGSLRPLRRGVAWLARHTGARVVPVAIGGGYQAWPRGWGFTPHPYRIRFGEPLDPPPPDGTAAEEARFLAGLAGRLSDLLRQVGQDPVSGDPLVFAGGPRRAKRRRAADRPGRGVRA